MENLLALTALFIRLLFGFGVKNSKANYALFEHKEFVVQNFSPNFEAFCNGYFLNNYKFTLLILQVKRFFYIKAQLMLFSDLFL